MTGLALYRMPYAKECTLLSGEIQEVSSCMELGGCQGFVIAPFAASQDEPVVVIQAEHIETAGDGGVFKCLPLKPLQSSVVKNLRDDYHIDFLNFHAHLKKGAFQKLVLTRSLDLPRQEGTPEELFHRACQRYPRLFVALVYTPQTGMWLVATPETLLSGEDGYWQTMALAGTTAWHEGVMWDDKNLQEQRYVATYITRQLEQFSDNFTEEGPYTARAGHLAHLRSDFRFTLYDNARVGELLHALHPTPAVCGLPKEEARQFILQNEHHRRSYYSGFMGPLFVKEKTHLFVTLRCMQIFADAYRLYAGGGLLTDSVEEEEWQETETKLDTMRHILSAHV